MRKPLPLIRECIALTTMYRSLLLLLFMLASYLTARAQFTCTAGNVYGIRALAPPSPGISDLQNLYQIHPTTGAPTFQVNLFGSPPALFAPVPSTSAIALDPYNNRIYYAQNAALNPTIGASIYSYNLTTGTFTTTAAPLPFAGGVGVQDNWNKAAFNPVDRKLYLHDGTSNRVAIYNPAAPVVAGVNPGLATGTLTVPGLTSPTSFTGGDIAFDGLGNLTAIFAPSTTGNSVMAVFPAVFNAAGAYLGVSTSGTQVFSFPATQTATGIAFRNDGQLLVSINSFTSPMVALNVATQTQTPIPGNQPGFPLSDLTSCVFPSPNFLTFTKAASFTCTGTQTNIRYTVKVKNSGLIFSNNTTIYDTLPAGVTVSSVTLNGTAIAGASNATLMAGVRINTPGDAAGVVNIATTDTAILVINATAPAGQATYSNKAWLTYHGIQVTGVSKQGSDNPATPASGDATSITTTCLQVSGTVFNDANGLTDNIINGTGSNGGGLNVVIVNPFTGNVIATAPVAANGTYTVNGLPSGTFTALITTGSATVGSPPPAITLPANYASTGEGATAAGDGTPNGSTTITLGSTSLTGLAFGMEQLPSTTTGTTPAVTNPGGTISVPIAASSFGGTDPDGTVTSLRITSFPSNASSITINGTTYTSATFPPAGIMVPTNTTGQPTQPVSIDPADGSAGVVLTYAVIDNAGKEDPTPGTLTIPFNTATVSGTVFNDANGTTDNLINGTGSNAGGLNAVLVDPITGNVVATVPVAGDGTFALSGVNGGNYNLILTTNAATVGNPAPAIALPPNWVHTAEGTTSAGDGIPNGSTFITVSNGNITGANFGIEQLPASNTITALGITNPGGTNSAPIPASSFGGTDPDGTIASLRITSFPTNTSSITINGTTYTAVDFPVAGVTVPTNATGQPTQAISIDPVDGAANVVISYSVIDNAGKEAATPGTTTIPFTTSTVSGIVFNDPNGNTDNQINGNPGNAGGLNAVLVDPVSGNVVATVPVAANGTYVLSNVNGGNYNLILTTNTATVGSPAPAIALPPNWVNTAEGTIASGDGTPNGSTSITVSSGDLTGANFGIEQLPATNTGTAPAIANPGGTNSAPIPAAVFSGTDPDGVISAILISTFPTNATSITINGTIYSSATFPPGGVTVPTNASGQPTQSISIDPVDGTNDVVLAYSATDNAGKASPTPGSLTIPFVAVTVSGVVYNDANGLMDNLVNGTGNNAGGLNAVLVNPVSGNVVAITAVAVDGTYTFSGVTGGNFNLLITTNAATVGSPAPAIALPANWVSTGEGTAINGDDTPDGTTMINITNGNVIGANFGIDQLPATNPVSAVIDQPSVDQFITLNGAGGNPPAPAGFDPEDGILGGGNSITILQVPANAELYYNGVLVTNNQVINNLDPSLLQLKFTTPGTISAGFQYTFTDAAGVASPSPVTYEVNWAIPLPITLGRFTLEKKNMNILLQWITSSEQNSKEFVVERSTSNTNGNWKTIGTIPAAGNSNSELQYSFTDVLPATGNNFYRLRMVDKDGQFSLSEIRTASFTGDGLTIRAYPNPVRSTLYLVRDADVTGTTNAQLIDQNGRVMQVLQLTDTKTELDMGALPQGIYFIRYTHKDGKAHTIKVLKQ